MLRVTRSRLVRPNAMQQDARRQSNTLRGRYLIGSTVPCPRLRPCLNGRGGVFAAGSCRPPRVRSLRHGFSMQVQRWLRDEGDVAFHVPAMGIRRERRTSARASVRPSAPRDPSAADRLPSSGGLSDASDRATRFRRKGASGYQLRSVAAKRSPIERGPGTRCAAGAGNNSGGTVGCSSAGLGAKRLGTSRPDCTLRARVRQLEKGGCSHKASSGLRCSRIPGGRLRH